MKKSIHLSLVFAILTITLSAQSDRDKLSLKGSPKSVKSIEYKVVEKFGKITKTDIENGVKYDFDSHGFLLLKQQYGIKGAPINQIAYEYNKRHSPIKEDLKDAKGKLLQRTINEYNDINKLRFKSIYQSDGSLTKKSAYTYVSRYKLNRVVTYDKEGHEALILEYKYPKRKKYIEITTINPKSKVKTKVERYDLNAHLIMSAVYDVVGNLKNKFIFTYQNDKLVKSLYFIGDDEITRRELKYNDKGFLIEEKFHYPQKGVTEVYAYTYEYDNHANWLKRTKHINAVPVAVIEREITYY